MFDCVFEGIAVSWKMQSTDVTARTPTPNKDETLQKTAKDTEIQLPALDRDWP
jgi:hypothetical protein